MFFFTSFIKNNIKYFIPILLGFFWFTPVLAANRLTASQLLFPDSYTFLSAMNGLTGQTFVPLYSGNISQINVPLWRFQGTGATCSWSVGELGTVGKASRNRGTGATPVSEFRTTVPTTLSDWESFTWSTTTTPKNLVAGNTYWLQFTCGNGTQYSNMKILGSNSSVYSSGTFGTSTNNGTSITAQTLADQGFQIYIETNTTTIEFVETPNATCNFLNWGLQPYLSDTDKAACEASQTCSYGVRFNDFGSTTIFPYSTNAGGKLTPENGSSNFWNDIYYIFNNFNFTSGTPYGAQAYICTSLDPYDCTFGDLNLLAKSEPWLFIIDALDICTTTYFDQGNVQYPLTSNQNVSIQSIINQANAQCNAYRDGSVLGSVTWGMCQILVKLFVPSEASVSNLQDLGTAISDKPPFGYIKVYGESLDGLFSGTSTGSVYSTSSMFVSISAMASSLAWYQSFLTYLGYAIYIGIIFGIIRFFKNFSIRG